MKTLEVQAGNRFPFGATALSGGVNFSVFSRHATRMWLRLYRGATDEKPVIEIELDPREHRTYFCWHVYVVGARPGWLYTWRADGPHESGRGPALRRDARAARSLGEARERRGLAARARAPGRPNRRASGHRPTGPLRLGGRRATEAGAERYDRLRDARRRVHVASVGAREGAGHVSRCHREDSVPRVARGHGRRAAARNGVRPAGRAARGGRERLAQLLGLQPARLLRAASALRCGRRANRVSRHGEGAARRRNRRHSRRRVEPHGGGRRRRPGHRLQGADERVVLFARSRGPNPVPGLHGLRQHGEQQRAVRRAVPAPVPHVLGSRDARRRFQARPRERAVARHRRPTRGQRARDREHRVRGGARRHALDRGGVGRLRLLSGRLLAGLPLGRVERPLPRLGAQVLARRGGPARGDRNPNRGQQRHVREHGQGADQQRQLRHVSRRLHACSIS